MRGRKTFVLIVFACAGITSLLFGAYHVSAATLGFSAPGGAQYPSVAVGSTIAISVYVQSSDRAMNAMSGVVSFPQDNLELTSISKSGSIISLWVQEPSFSNAAGTASFEGIVLNPGFTGAFGKIITLNFKAKGVGQAPLIYSSGAVLANDGEGTNILSEMGMLTIRVYSGAQTSPGATTPTIIPGAPLAPIVESITHPDQDKWYSLDDLGLYWTTPKGVTQSRTLLDHTPISRPTVVQSPALSSIQYNDVKDGIWYFHVQLRNASGWGSITHFKAQIDTTPPNPFKVELVGDPVSETPRPAIRFKATDSVSDINRYVIRIGVGDPITVKPQDLINDIFILPTQAPGGHSVVVEAFDEADNSTAATAYFVIKAIAAPVITDYTKVIQPDEFFIVRGTTYPGATVTVFAQSKGGSVKSESVTSDARGNFTLIWPERLPSGMYEFWAQAVDDRGAVSEYTPTYTFAVKALGALRIGRWTISYGILVGMLLAVIIGLALLMWYVWWHLRKLSSGTRKRFESRWKIFSRFFVMHKRELEYNIRLLETAARERELTSQEKRLLDDFKEDYELCLRMLGKTSDLEEKGKS